MAADNVGGSGNYRETIEFQRNRWKISMESVTGEPREMNSVIISLFEMFNHSKNIVESFNENQPLIFVGQRCLADGFLHTDTNQ